MEVGSTAKAVSEYICMKTAWQTDSHYACYYGWLIQWTQPVENRADDETKGPEAEKLQR